MDREVIRMLANSGLLTVQKGVGTFVVKATPDKESFSDRLSRAASKDVDDIRQLLEVHIAKNAAIHRNQAQFDEMKFFSNARIQASLQGILKPASRPASTFTCSLPKRPAMKS